MESTFLILDVRHPILSVTEMCRNGAEVKFDTTGAYVLKNGHRQPLVRRGCLHFLPMRLLIEK
eukprot:9408573-Heterocapsa_arctica.AAC.1